MDGNKESARKLITPQSNETRFIFFGGKGGVGKTTLTSLLAYTYADMDYQVLAIDADPSPCLAGALAFPQELLDSLTPIARMDELIYERTGAQPGTTGGYFKINPRVDDIPDRFSAVHRGVRLLELGAVETAVKCASEEDIKRLKHLGEELRSPLEHSQDEIEEMEAEFHNTILSATGTRLLRDTHRVIVAFFRRSRQQFPEQYTVGDAYPWDHAAIAAAFADRNAERASSLMKAHFRAYFEAWDLTNENEG